MFANKYDQEGSLDEFTTPVSRLWLPSSCSQPLVAQLHITHSRLMYLVDDIPEPGRGETPQLRRLRQLSFGDAVYETFFFFPTTTSFGKQTSHIVVIQWLLRIT
jgi:hypothetical protein